MSRDNRTDIPALLAGATALALFAAVTLTPTPAQACGGFFCNQSAPVNQIGEHILFAVEDGVITAHVQIQYQGPAEAFSWVLPLPTVPDIGVGSDRLFTMLRNRTDPTFKIEWQNEGDCNYRNNCDCFLAGGADLDDDGATNEGSQVDILAAGAVGPYDYKVVSSGDGEALFNWLNENGYDVPEQSKYIVNSYADKDFVFVGLKLLKDKDAGDIQPIVLGYEADDMSCIPLQLTAIAADPDMPIFTWLLANARAVPLNYFHVVLNAKAFDWLNCSQAADNWGCGGFNSYGACEQAYLDLVSGAANSANGHGFVTEFAGASEVMKDAIYAEGMYDLDTLATLHTPKEFLQQMMWMGIPSTTLVQQIIKDHIPMPPVEDLPEDCDTDQEFYAIWNLDNCLQHMDPAWTFDPAGFVADLDMKFVKPLVEAQALFQRHPYLTRMFTTISPDEMSKDPLFSFNPDLPDVSNEHWIKATAECKEGSTWEANKITLTHQDGEEQIFHGDFMQCGFIDYDQDVLDAYPPAAEIQILGESGPPETVPADQVEDKDEDLDWLVPSPGQNEVPADPARNLRPIESTGTWATADPVVTTPPVDASPGDDGCNGSGGGAPFALAPLLAAALFLVRRRRAATAA